MAAKQAAGLQQAHAAQPGENVATGILPSGALGWVLDALCRWHRLRFDPALARTRFPPPHDRVVLREALGQLGLKSGEFSARAALLEALPVPFIAFLKPDPGQTALHPALIVKVADGHFECLVPQQVAPTRLPLAEFDSRFEPEVVLIAPDTTPRDAQALEEDAPPRFGFRWFVPALLAHRRIWRDVLIASAAIQLVGLATPLFTQVVVDKVVVHHSASTLGAVALGLAIFLVFNSVMGWLRQYLVIHTGNRVDAALASEVFAHLFRLPVPYFEHRATGTTVARLQGVETIREFVTGAAVALALDVPFVLIVLAVMFAYSWQLTLIALAAVLGLCVLAVAVTPLLRRRLNTQFMLGARNQAFVTEYVSGLETVKSLQFEPVLERRYDEYLSSYLAAGFATRKLSNTYQVVSGALEQAMTGAILVVGALLVMRADGFTIGMLVAFQMFASRMAQPMMRIAGLWQEFQQATIAVQRLGDIMNAPAEPYSAAPLRAARREAGGIEVQALAFRYGEAYPFLYRDLSIDIPAGSLTVIAGASGSGKSTLAKLLLGFYPPSEGRVLIDGLEVRQLAANELRRAFGVVPQETVLFSGTVFDNLVMADPHADIEEAAAACRAAGIHDAIEALPKGYATVLGEHGVGLSGGQKQRIAIARALLKKPRILIFDEATSSLDVDTAEAIADTVNGLKGRVTILFIAHHVPTRLQADAVVRLG